MTEINCERCRGTGRLLIRGDIDKECPDCRGEGTVDIFDTEDLWLPQP